MIWKGGADDLVRGCRCFFFSTNQFFRNGWMVSFVFVFKMLHSPPYFCLNGFAVVFRQWYKPLVSLYHQGGMLRVVTVQTWHVALSS